MVRLIYCSVLIGATEAHELMKIPQKEEQFWSYRINR